MVAVITETHAYVADANLGVRSVPLCVDLDGTVIKSDLLWESALTLLKQDWRKIFSLPIWLLRGRARCKHEIAKRAKINATTLPYDESLVARLRAEHDSGREIVLVTAANRELANRVAMHLDVFTAVHASDEYINLKGNAKANLLRELFGPGNFDYIGDSRADVPIWRIARSAFVANPTRDIEIAARNSSQDVVVIGEPRPAVLRTLPKAMRLHQWLKNLLVFIPLATSHQLSVSSFFDCVFACIAFSLCASGVYILNDLFDLQSDRAHPRKRMRVLASGLLPISIGFAAVPFLLGASALIGALLPTRFQLILLAYFLATCAYSFYLKRIVLVDVVILAGLYTLRVIAGAAAIRVEPSFWLLAFSMFLFFSLALVKRSAELTVQNRNNKPITEGRGYRTADHEYLHSMGTASGYLAVLVIALYINSPQVTQLYSEPRALWLLCPLLLYWTSRMWLKAGRGEMHDDPLVFSALDPVSQKILALCGAAILLAIYL